MEDHFNNPPPPSPLMTLESSFFFSVQQRVIFEMHFQRANVKYASCQKLKDINLLARTLNRDGSLCTDKDHSEQGWLFMAEMDGAF